MGVTAQDNFSTTAAQGIGADRAQGGPGGDLPPGFDQAAAELCVEASILFDALNAAGGRDADLAGVAAILGVTEDALRATLLARR